MDVLRLGSFLPFPAVVSGLATEKKNGTEKGRERDAELREGEYLFSGHHLHPSRPAVGLQGTSFAYLGSVAARCLGPSLRLYG